MGLKSFLRRWLEVPEGYVEVATPLPEAAVVLVPIPPEEASKIDPKVADALAIGGVIHGHTPPPPRHEPRKIPNNKPGVACIVDPNDPNALLAAMKR